jgi:2-polyprenyl-6-methoxyphenol hydroxylase-like FAD-dependent oxidoreductase
MEKPIYHDSDGSLLGESYWGSKRRYGYSGLRIDRIHVLKALEQAVRARGVDIWYGTSLREVVSESDEEGVTVLVRRQDNGTSRLEEMRTGMLIGSDGIHSRTRKWIADIEPVFSGFVGVATTVAREVVDFGDWKDETLTEVLSISTDHGNALFVPKTYSGDLIQAARQFSMPEKSREGWQAMNDNKDGLQHLVQQYLEKFPLLVQSVLRNGRKEEMYIWPHYSLPTLRTPISEKGRVVAIGDAFHTIIPAAGQGANQAIEDAWTLAELFAKTNGTYPGRDSLEVWQIKRQDRVERVRVLSHQLMNLRLSLAEQRKLPPEDKVDLGGTEEERLARIDWLFGEDINREV